MIQVIIPEGYEVTACGRVISHKRGAPRELRAHPNGSGHGYPSVWIYVKGRRKHYAIYRLVAAVHLPPRPSSAHFVCHKDGNRDNSRAENLYWGLASDNQLDTWRHRRERKAFALEHLQAGCS